MRRDKTDIIYDILSTCSSGARKTKIVYSANLNFKSSNYYIDMLSENGLIERDSSDKCYRTTPKGKETLTSLNALKMRFLWTAPLLVDR